MPHVTSVWCTALHTLSDRPSTVPRRVISLADEGTVCTGSSIEMALHARLCSQDKSPGSPLRTFCSLMKSTDVARAPSGDTVKTGRGSTRARLRATTS